MVSRWLCRVDRVFRDDRFYIGVSAAFMGFVSVLYVVGLIYLIGFFCECIGFMIGCFVCLVVFLSVASGGGSVFSMVFFWSVVSSAGVGVPCALSFPPCVVTPLPVVCIMAYVPLSPVLPFILLVTSHPHLDVSLALLSLGIIYPRPT